MLACNTKKELFDNNPILKLLVDFALMVIEYCKGLESANGYTVARQLLKCGTSIGANATEAQNAESKADFIYKMKIAAKEAEESQYWLWRCQYSKGYPDSILLQNKLEDINKVLGKILAASKGKSPFSYFLSFSIF
ncbi:four helix bundle protein [Segetibacter sp.]|uniref:four helix bundle protein n=1 Tax=Segetibacter sp. TaxID=2231182 RepID=UPI0026300C6A|nr:four helix bundle protein [Segetibacter sp.]